MSDISRIHPVQGIVEKPGHDLLPQGEVRASDRDRKRAASHLISQQHAGRLTTEIFEARRAAAMDARSLRDLDALTTDLPPLRARRSLLSAFQRRCIRAGFILATFAATLIGSMLVYHAENSWWYQKGTGWYMVESLSGIIYVILIWVTGLSALAVQGVTWWRWEDSQIP